jgi:hypothetical protein
MMTSPVGQSCFNQKTWGHFQPGRFNFLLCTFALMTTLTSANAGPLLDTGNPVRFFTNVASCLLHDYSQEWLEENPSNFVTTFNTTNAFGITNIPVLVGNQFVYTPATHRLLQVAANIYEATSTNSYPSVFRPLFSRDAGGLGTNLFISGFTNVDSVNGLTDSQLALPMEAIVLAETNVPIVDLPVNVYGVPWIIGAKRGFPNFNEFSMQSVVQVTRKLELTRPTLSALPSDVQTNQMYILSISNVCGVECWNSYSVGYTSAVPNGVQIAAQDCLSMTLTHDDGMFPISLSVLAANITNLPAQWPGTSQPWVQNPNPNSPNSNSFVIPLFTNVILFTNLTYVYRDHQFEGTTNFPDLGIQPLPQFGLLTTNCLRVVMLDGNHVIDYVQFAGPDSSFNLNAELADVDPTGLKGLWNTNISGTVPYGVVNQIIYSDNPIQNRATTLTANDDNTWANPPGGGTAGQAIASFDSFLNQVINGSLRGIGTDPNTHITYYATNLNLTVQVPFTPTRTVFNYISWQANDPLVHYLASDLNYVGLDYNSVATGTTQWNKTSSSFPILPDLGQLNKRYQPWGRSLQIAGTDSNPYNLATKDSLVYSSDDWDFPTNQPMSGAWLGRVHRGTPWQTVYLKAPDVLGEVQVTGGAINYFGTNTWMYWIGDSDIADAVAMAPVQDRHLASLLVYLMNTNNLQSLFSVNNPNPTAWLNLFNGLTVLTNILSDAQISSLMPPEFDPVVISSNSPQVAAIVSSILSARASQPSHLFSDVGNILADPQLTVQSPFLNQDPSQQTNGISDEAYEILPSQLLPLLRADSVGSIASTNGQITAQFTGYDNHTYAIEVSSNLVNWTSISTNPSVNGGFGFTNVTPANASPQFYRSVLLQ